MWRAFMDEVLKTDPGNTFTKPQKEYSYAIKPVIRGLWQGGISNIAPGTVIDPNNQPQEVLSGGVHSILYWLNKDDPRGSKPENPSSDPQFDYWEYSVRKWASENNYQ